MADMEVLAPGGHQHLVGKIKEQLDLKADASLASAVEKVIENQPTAVLGGEVLTASDAYAAPPMAFTVEGKSTQDGTPTPDAPVEIVSLENPELTIAGKNVFDSSLLLRAAYSSFDGEYYKVSGYRLNQTFPLSNGGFPVPIDGRQVAISFDGMNVSGGADTDGINFIFVYEDNTTQVLRVHGETLSHYSMVSDASKTLKALRFSYNTNVDAKLKNIQFEYGSTATAYEPYAGTTVPLYDGTLRSLPNGTKDTLALTYLRPSAREGWAWYTPTLTQRCYEDVLSGPCVYSNNSEALDNSLQFKVPYTSTPQYNKLSYPNIAGWVCDCLTIARTSGGNSAPNWGEPNQANWPDSIAWAYNNPSNASVCMLHSHLGTSRDATVAENKAAIDAYLQEHPITLCYPLADPITTTLDPIELPVLPAPDATVWSEPGTGLRMEYVRDTNIAFAQLEAALAEIATS